MYAFSEAEWGREILKPFEFLVKTGKDGTFFLPQSLRDSSLIRGSLVRSQQPSERKRSFTILPGRADKCFLYCSEAFPFTQPPKSAARFPPGEGIGRRGGQPALARSRRSFRCCHSRDFPPSELKYPGDSAIIGLFRNPLTGIPVPGENTAIRPAGQRKPQTQSAPNRRSVHWKSFLP